MKIEDLIRPGMNGGGSSPMQIAQPFNDIQLVAMVAAQMQGNWVTKDRVGKAMELVAEAIVQMQGGHGLTRLVEQKQRSLLESQ